MILQFPAPAWPLLLATLTVGWLFGALLGRPGRHLLGYFTVLVGVAFSWAFLALLAYVVTDTGTSHTLLHLRYIPIVLTPVTWFLFSLAYSGGIRRLRSWHVLALLTVPAGTLFLLATNSYHHLLFVGMEVVRPDGWARTDHIYGPWFAVHMYFSYGTFAAGALVMFGKLVRSNASLRGRAALMLCGALVPGVMSMIYMANSAIFAHVDPAPIAFSFSTVCFALGVFRYDVLDIVPTGRGPVFTTLQQGIIVLNGDGRVLDINPAAQRMVEQRSREAVGHSAQGLIRDLWDRTSSGQAIDQVETEIQGQIVWLECSVSPVVQDEFGQAWVFVLTDVTQRKLENLRLESALFDSERRCQAQHAAYSRLEMVLAVPTRGMTGLSQVLAEELEGEAKGFATIIHQAAQRFQTALGDASEAFGTRATRSPGPSAQSRKPLPGPGHRLVSDRLESGKPGTDQPR